MLSFDDFKQKLTSVTPGSGWLHAYVDRSGCFWIQGYGCIGTTIFKRLDCAHLFVDYIETLLKDDNLEQQPFKYEYEAGEELARLAPNERLPGGYNSDMGDFDSLDEEIESDVLRSDDKKKGAAKGILSNVKVDETVTDDETIMSAIASSNRDIEEAISEGEESGESTRPFNEVVTETIRQCKVSEGDGGAESIADLLELDDQEANEFMDRTDLIIELREKYKHTEISKSEFAARIGLTLSVTEELLSGHIEKFTAETLRACMNKISKFYL